MSGADLPDGPAAVATALLGRPVDSIEALTTAGRNSRIYRVRCGGSCFALKHYPPREGVGRDRLDAEVGALALMTGCGIAAVPRVFGNDAGRGYALLEWVEGDAVTAPEAADIDAAVEFLAAVHRLRTLAAARTQPLAAEACLSGGETVSQVERRLARLADIAADEPPLAAFLAAEVRPLLREITASAETAYAGSGLSFAEPIGEAARTLCPSDFGFHNALRRPSGGLVFLDFDYFGWDDPAKLVSDFLLHPGMALADKLKRRFAKAAADIYGGDPAFAVRLRALYPLFALRWCMILLNEFLPERWAYRLHAGASAADWRAAKTRQLERAREWVQSLVANFRWFPYA